MTLPRRLSPALIATAALLVAGPPAVAATRPATGLLRIEDRVAGAAISGDGIIVARRSRAGRVVVERRVRGRRTVVLARATLDLTVEVRVAASGAATAVSFGGGSTADPAPSWVLVGPPAGPLREVARCPVGSELPALAVAGSRVAWADGGCLVGPLPSPDVSPLVVGPAAVGLGDADPAVAPRRVPVPEGTVPVALSLGGARGLVATTRVNRDFLYNSETRRLDGDALGEIVFAAPRALVLPAGVDSEGRGVLFEPGLDQADEDSEETRSRCPRILRLPSAGVTRRLSLDSPPCLGGDGPDEYTGSISLSRGRVVTLTERASFRDPIAKVVSARADGEGRPRVLARGTRRAPSGVTAANGTVAWSQPTCRGLDTELVTIRDAPRRSPRTIRSCPVRR